MAPQAFVDLPSQEFALFGRAILEDFNQIRLPRIQVRLCPGPIKFTFRCASFIRVKWGGDKVKVYDGEMPQCS